MAEKPSAETNPASCVLVIFGASGDLTRRKLVPALYALETEGLLGDGFRVVGFARTTMTDAEFAARLGEALGNPGGEAWERFASRLSYVSGGYSDPAAYARLGARLGELGADCAAGGYLFYLALPPEAAEDVLRGVSRNESGLPCPSGAADRVMVEKPFGRDLEGARRLNALCAARFAEENIYRIDHFLAKDTVRNLLVFRFGNAVFEHLWNRKYVDSVQITAAETIGVEGRGGYYEGAGVVRDMLQNHLLQVMALVAMEPPVAGDPESVRDRKVEVFKSLAPAGPGDFVFGQYRGYRQEQGVAPDSATPTFAALKLNVRNWRWEGVPFYLRSGKCLAKKVTEVVIGFKEVPTCVLESPEACELLRANRLIIRLQPEEGIRLSFCTRVPGREERIAEADLDFRYSELGGALSDAYEQVLLDGLAGRGSYFWRADGVEAAWRAVAPLLEAGAGGDFPSYEPGTWGPGAADELLARDGRAWLASY
ncbi:MAG: glucose-6-phosphate dehydrogenase [Planctomycetota bacterium]|jgi:glucose-6-phosphate 1-dehydrogenase